MARKRKLTMGVINITMHPHKPELYVELLKEAVRLKALAGIGNLQSALINRASPLEMGAKNAAVLSGTVARFQNIDMDGAWFDTSSSTIADESELAEINIPGHLKPNSTLYDFVFVPSVHKFFYEMESKDAKISPLQMEKALKDILNHPVLEKKYGRVEVTNVPEVDKLEKALAIKSISSVVLSITRPNADHFSTIERRFLAQMSAENVAEIYQEKKAVKGESINVTPDLRNAAKIAEQNGYAEVRGHDDSGSPVNFSTRTHPVKIASFYDSGTETTLSFLLKMALSFLGLK